MDPGAHGVGCTVRRATVDDAQAIAVVHTRTWQVAYADIMPADYLAGLSVTERTARWRGILRRPPMDPASVEDIPRVTWVAAVAGTVQGFASVGPPRDSDALPRDAELYALYVLPEAWRTGAGRALLATAVEHVTDAGARAVSLWVLRDNPRARGFYMAMGFTPDGGHRDDAVGGVTLGHVRYRMVR